jgi:carboxylesterase
MTTEPATAVIPGAEPWSHEGTTTHGVLVLHGFTGNPSSVRGLATAFAADGFHVEMPRLPGHGTTVDDMLTTRWADWAAEAESAYHRLAARVERVVVAGLSMGGTLTLATAIHHPAVAGAVCINPLTQPAPPEILDALRSMADAGTDVIPGIGSDIADPDVTESAYDGTPVRPLLSLFEEGVAPLVEHYPSSSVPMLLLTSRQDHVVDPANSDALASAWGGEVQRIWLDRSYHVATQDYDRGVIEHEAVAFARRVTG